MVYKNTVNAFKIVLTQQQFQIEYNGNTDLSLVREGQNNLGKSMTAN